MWNVADGKYSNVYYGANFVNQIGHGKPNLVMVRPTNGLYYETFIYSQYFTTVVDGAVAKQDATLEAIEAINRIPAEVTLADDAIVISARELYDKASAIDDQKALIENYTTLVSAESTILALKSLEVPSEPAPDEPSDVVDEKDTNVGAIVLIVAASVIGAVIVIIAIFSVVLVIASIKTQAPVVTVLVGWFLKRVQNHLVRKLARQTKKMEKSQLKAIKKAKKKSKKAKKKSSKDDIIIE
jgi:hypothetical protein